MSSGRASTTGPGLLALADCEGARDEFGDAIRPVDLRDPFRNRCEHLPVVDFLKTGALGGVGAYLADEQDHGSAVLMRDMKADGGICGARTARDEADTRLSCQLAIGLRRIGCAAFLPAGHGADAVATIAEGVDAWKKTFTRHHEDSAHAMQFKLPDENLPTMSRGRRSIGCGH